MSSDEGSPVLATTIGCIGILTLPALLVAAMVFLGYKYWTASKEAGSRVPARPAVPAPGPGSRQRTKPQVTRSERFSPGDLAAIGKIMHDMGSADARLQLQAWNNLHAYHVRNAVAVRGLLIQELKRSRSPHYFEKASWGLCQFYGETGRKAVEEVARLKSQETKLLEGMAKGVNALGDIRTTMKRRIRTVLTRSKSPSAKLFE